MQAAAQPFVGVGSASATVAPFMQHHLALAGPVKDELHHDRLVVLVIDQSGPAEPTALQEAHIIRLFGNDQLFVCHHRFIRGRGLRSRLTTLGMGQRLPAQSGKFLVQRIVLLAERGSLLHWRRPGDLEQGITGNGRKTAKAHKEQKQEDQYYSHYQEYL